MKFSLGRLEKSVSSSIKEAAFAAETPRWSHLLHQPVSFYVDAEEDPPLLLHTVSCGQGNTILLVLPDATTVLVDCNLTTENQTEIIRFLKRSIPERSPLPGSPDCQQWIDLFVNTHRDQDHLRGLQTVNEAFPVLRILESGVSGQGTQGSDYKYFMQLRRNLIKREGEDAVAVAWRGMTMEQAGVTLTCLNADVRDEQEASLRRSAIVRWAQVATPEMEAALLTEAAKEQHTYALVFMVEHGGRVIMIPGDSDYIAWRDSVVPWARETRGDEWLSTDVLLASHHGSREFFTDTNNDEIDVEARPETTYIEHIELMKPHVTLVSCGISDKLPNQKAMGVYRSNTSNEQVYCTTELGTVTSVIAGSGRMAVVPDRFREMPPKNSTTFSVDLEVLPGAALTVDPGEREAIFNVAEDAEHPRVCFSAKSYAHEWKLSDGCCTLDWEVSNAGEEWAHGFQQCYLKSKDEREPKHQFARQVVYQGLHLLRAHLHVHKGGNHEHYTLIWRIRGIA